MSARSLAAVFNAPGQDLELKEFPLPRLAPGEALVRVRCCTLCGSDLHTYQGRRPAPVPTILGHEILGTVEELGAGRSLLDGRGRPLVVGDRITWSIAASCGDCFYCGHELPQKCERLFKYGHEEIRAGHPLSGGLAEYCHLTEGTAVFAVEESLPDEVACPASCATATVVAALRAAGKLRDDVVLIQGAGMLGLTACALARSRGASEVIACDIDADRLQLASPFGATRSVLITEDREELKRSVEEWTGGRGVDLALELSGSAIAVESGLELLRIGGRYILVGAVFPTRPVSLSAETVVRRMLSLRGVHNYAPDDLGEALTFLAGNHQRYPFSELITETFPLRQVERAFQHAITTRATRVAVRP